MTNWAEQEAWDRLKAAAQDLARMGVAAKEVGLSARIAALEGNAAPVDPPPADVAEEFVASDRLGTLG